MNSVMDDNKMLTLASNERIPLIRRSSKDKNEYSDDNTNIGNNNNTNNGQAASSSSSRMTSNRPNESPKQLQIEINLSTIESTYSNPNVSNHATHAPSTGSSSQANSLVTTPVITPTNATQGNQIQNDTYVHTSQTNTSVTKESTTSSSNGASNSNSQHTLSQTSQSQNSSVGSIGVNGGNQSGSSTTNSSHRSHAYQARRDSATRALHGTASLNQTQGSSMVTTNNLLPDQRHVSVANHSKSMSNVLSSSNITTTPMKVKSSNLEGFEGVEKRKNDADDDDAFKGLYAQSKMSSFQNNRKNKSNPDLQNIANQTIESEK